MDEATVRQPVARQAVAHDSTAPDGRALAATMPPIQPGARGRLRDGRRDTKTGLSGFAAAGRAASLAVLLSALPLFGDSRASWKPIDPAQLALRESTVEKGASAEVLFWEIEIDDSGSRTVYRNYIRIKIFTPAGAEAHSTRQITYWESGDVKDIAARTIKPDGSVIEMPQSAVIEQRVLRFGKLKRKAKSFVLPGVEPGCIIEYRWREEEKTAGYFRVDLQTDVPIQLLEYSVKSAPYLHEASFNGDPLNSINKGRGLSSSTLTNVPSLKTEPYMPPLDSARKWSLFYYDGWGGANWDYPRFVHRAFRSQMKVSGEVRKVAQELIGDAATPDGKLRPLFEFCRDKIRRVDDDGSGVSADDRARFRENKTPADTLRQRMGTGSDANLLFAALATAAGFKARISQVADRSVMLYGARSVSDPLIPYLMTARHIAVLVGTDWRFFDPASVHVPYGMLRWEEEGEKALVCDPEVPSIQRTPLSPPERSVTRRSATLRLLADGTLEGEAGIELSGHSAAEWREENRPRSPEERERHLRDALKSRVSSADISEIHFDSVSESDKPLAYSYKVRIPAYAQRVGSRLLLQPALFQRGKEQEFVSSGDRVNSIYFAYPWSEKDTVTIELPEEYQLEGAELPAGFNAGKDMKYVPKLSSGREGRTLIYSREFLFGGTGEIIFDPINYPAVKTAFDYVHNADNHTLALKRSPSRVK